MGIGLVDPILKPIADELGAGPSQVSLLFTSYLAVMGIAMLGTGWVSSRVGAKRTLLLGLALIIIGAGLAGSQDTVGGIVAFRALWGLGNALFIATALATIVNAAAGSVGQAIILYEAMVGVGIATGPLVGGWLEEVSWRWPFFGVATHGDRARGHRRDAPATPPPARGSSISAPLRALGHRGLLTVGVTALLYNFGFFTLLAFTPFPLDLGAQQIGLIFFGWGCCSRSPRCSSHRGSSVGSGRFRALSEPCSGSRPSSPPWGSALIPSPFSSSGSCSPEPSSASTTP